MNNAKFEATILLATLDAKVLREGVNALECHLDEQYGLDAGDILDAVAEALIGNRADEFAAAVETAASVSRRPTEAHLALGLDYLRSLFTSLHLFDDETGEESPVAITRAVFGDVSPSRVLAEVLAIVAAGGSIALGLIATVAATDADDMMGDTFEDDSDWDDWDEENGNPNDDGFTPPYAILFD